MWQILKNNKQFYKEVRSHDHEISTDRCVCAIIYFFIAHLGVQSYGTFLQSTKFFLIIFIVLIFKTRTHNYTKSTNAVNFECLKTRKKQKTHKLLTKTDPLHESRTSEREKQVS